MVSVPCFFRGNTACTKAPNSELQTPNSKQAPNLKLQTKAPSDVVAIQGGPLRFEAWNLFGAWSLELSGPVIPFCLARQTVVDFFR